LEKFNFTENPDYKKDPEYPSLLNYVLTKEKWLQKLK
jgi:hypothetical protein